MLYDKAYVKSYSWTWIRTPKEALELALRKSWEKFTKKKNIACPPEIMAEIDRLPERDLMMSRSGR